MYNYKFIRKNILSCLLLILPLVITGCGIQYEKFTSSLKANVANNTTIKFPPLTRDNINYLLYNQEAGLYYFLRNDNTASLKHINNAITTYNILEESNKVTLRKTLAFTFLSDTLLNYEGSDFEKGLLHYYAGLIYLQNKDLNSAAIEFKAAEQNQKFSESVRQKQIIASEDKINAFLKQNQLKSKDIDQALTESRKIRADARNKFLNANLLYLAGITRELNGAYNDVYIDYKQAYNLYPTNHYLLEDLYRLSLNFNQDFADTLKKQNLYLQKLNFNNYKQEKTIYLIYEQGFVPRRKNIVIPLIGIFDSNLLLTIKLPIYAPNFSKNTVNLIATKDNNTNLLAKAEESSNIFTLAANNLAENYPVIIMRQLTKLASQIITTKALNNQQNLAPLSFALGLSSLLDSADTRSWSLLPNTTQIAKISTPENIKDIKIEVNNNKVITLPKLNVQNSQIAIIYVFDAGNTIYNKIIYQGNK